MLMKSVVQENKPKHFWLVFFTILLLFISGLYCNLKFGAVNYSNQDLIRGLSHPFTSSDIQDVLIDVRIPRIIGALLVGSAMATAGSIMQGITRNPIADPGLLGINAGSALALIIGYAFFRHLHYSLILLLCLLGATLAALLVFSLSYSPRKGYNQLRLILAGAMIATLFNSFGQAIVIYFNLSTSVIGWQAGGLVALNWNMIKIIAPFILIGLCLAQLFAHQLTILSLNETVAKSLGQKTFMMTAVFLGLVLLLSASAVALVGSLAFVGLIIPHFIRMFVGRNYRYLLPLTAFLGAVFMLWVDLICRTLNPGYETPLSAVISLIGLPCFLWLIRRGRQL